MNLKQQALMHASKIKSIKPLFCDEQSDDIQHIFDLADGMAAAATSITATGGQGYQSLVEAREEFQNYVISVSKKYRIIVE